MPQHISKKCVAPITTRSPQRKGFVTAAFALSHQRILQFIGSVLFFKINAQHLLWQLPRPQTIDLTACSLVESSSVTALVLEQFNVDWHFPKGFEILYINPCVWIPEVGRFRSDGNHWDFSINRVFIDEIGVSHRWPG